MGTVDRLFAKQRHLRQQGGEPDRRTKLLRHQKAVSPIHPNSARVALPLWQCHFGNDFMGQRRDPIRIGMNPVGGLRPCFLLFFPRGRLPPPARSHFAFGSAHDTSGNTFRRSRLKISDQMFWNRHAVPPAAFVHFPEVADFHQSGAAFFQHPFPFFCQTHLSAFIDTRGSVRHRPSISRRKNPGCGSGYIRRKPRSLSPGCLP